jgi:hypothetical protein
LEGVAAWTLFIRSEETNEIELADWCGMGWSGKIGGWDGMGWDGKGKISTLRRHTHDKDA